MPKETISLRVDPDRLEKLDDLVEEAKDRQALPPTASRSDLLRIAADMVVEDTDVDDELKERAMEYFRDES